MFAWFEAKHNSPAHGATAAQNRENIQHLDQQQHKIADLWPNGHANLTIPKRLTFADTKKEKKKSTAQNHKVMNRLKIHYN